MIRVDPFHPFDLIDLPLQASQADLPADRVAFGEQRAACGRSFTIRDAPGGRALFCGGTIVTHANLATLWSVVAADAGPRMMAITRRVRWFVDALPHARVDAMIRGGFAPAARWVEMLGFEKEALLADYYENGDDAMIYRLHR